MTVALSLFPAYATDEAAGQESAALDPYAPDALRCERRAVTGSRVRRVRICLTNAEWAALRDAGNRDAGNLVDSGSITGCGRPGVDPDGC
ncbi:hypothetical protein H6P80_00695 [Parasphingopyxis sp. GrpM-11]|uniref:Uncharacterized protein n=2 Tax=Parasphingopyxis marina TaxID=2761622 RepID=A0A842HT53_9SPHN|nr:hypothetical protein [Parasphingopyxis marina]